MTSETRRQSSHPRRAARGLVAILSGVALLAGAPATAAAQPASPCPTTGSLSDLVNFGGTGCVVGDKLFQFFGSTITSDFGTTLTEANITYTLINPAPGALIHGFELSGAWFAPPGGTLDHNLRYRVTTLSGAPLIGDVHLLQTGEDVLGIPPTTGFVSIAEDVCVGALFLGGCAPGGGFIASVNTLYSESPALYGQSVHEDHAAWLPGVALIDVDKDILVYGGNGGALFSNFHQTVSQVPEPATVGLLGAGLGLLGLVVRARRRMA